MQNQHSGIQVLKRCQNSVSLFISTLDWKDSNQQPWITGSLQTMIIGQLYQNHLERVPTGKRNSVKPAEREKSAGDRGRDKPQIQISCPLDLGSFHSTDCLQLLYIPSEKKEGEWDPNTLQSLPDHLHWEDLPHLFRGVSHLKGTQKARSWQVELEW